LPLTFPGFASVAVFITDQSKYTEKLERKKRNRKKIDNHFRILINPEPRHWCKRLLAVAILFV